MDVLPITLNKKNRPTWIGAEITNTGYKENSGYAGRKHTGWCYDLYVVNGKGEKVPEAYMIACKRNRIPPTPSSSGILAAPTPETLFKVGHSVLWFWASWFSSGDVWPHSGTREP